MRMNFMLKNYLFVQCKFDAEISIFDAKISKIYA